MDTSFKSGSEYKLLQIAYLGSRDVLLGKLNYLAKIAQKEKWDFQGRSDKAILYNYLCFTFDKLYSENNIAYSDDQTSMCFNTGLLNNYDVDIFALFERNTSPFRKLNQDWFLQGFKLPTDSDMKNFQKLPQIADYFTNPEDFIFNKNLDIFVNYEHIIEDNIERFEHIGLSDRYTIKALLQSAINRITEKVKRNYKLAIPQYYTDKSTGNSKIQLLLPLFLKNQDVADLALAVDKDERRYVGRTILTIEWAYMNSRRIVKPEVDWLRI